MPIFNKVGNVLRHYVLTLELHEEKKHKLEMMALRGCGCDTAGAVEMHHHPIELGVFLALPDAGLLAAVSLGPPVAIHRLCQSNADGQSRVAKYLQFRVVRAK